MPLKPCGECGREISAQAVTCPNCGARTEYALIRSRLRVMSVAAVVFLVIVALFVWRETRPTPSERYLKCLTDNLQRQIDGVPERTCEPP